MSRRSSLLTGRFPQHVNMHNLAHSIPGAGIPLGMSTIAEKLKTRGYQTHSVVSARIAKASRHGSMETAIAI
jgi:arylsulfatase A-like enzyme